MLSSYLLYLVEASFCLAVFALAYRLLLARLTYFSWNRWYLLGSVLVALVLPLLSFPGLAYLLAAPAADSGSLLLQLNWTRPAAATASTASAASSLNVWAWALGGMLVVYAAGALYRLQNLGRNLWWLRQLARRHPRTNKGAYWLMELSNPKMPAFSFGRSVFLSPLHASLSPTERQLLLQHELVHVQQRHTLDILLLEGVAVLLWFNPAVYYVRQQPKEAHEYLADAAVAGTAGRVSGYSQLLLKLAAQQFPFSLVHAFSTKQLVQRITMLTTPSSRPLQKLRFLLIVPILAGAWMATSCVDSPTPAAPVASAATSATTTTPIGRITWEGNTLVSTERLNQALGLKPGDAYDSLDVVNRLNYRPDGRDVTSLYMDQGCLYFAILRLIKRQPNGSVDLNFKIVEGRKALLGSITFTGNGKIPVQSLLEAIPLRSGDMFSRAKLMEAQKNLAQLGPFNSEKIGINPIPVERKNAATDLVNIAFTLIEKE